MRPSGRPAPSLGPRPGPSPALVRAAPWLVLLGAAAGGVVWALAFEPRSWVVASWVALSPLIVLMGRRRAGWLGFVHGLVSWMVALAWIPATLVTFGAMPHPLSVVLLGLLAAYLGLYHALFAWLGAPLFRRGGFLALAGLPALWAALEWLRTYAGGGFPWNLAAYAWVDVPGALPLAAWIGPYGVSGLVVLTATGAALAVSRRRWEPLAAALVVPLLLLPLAGRWSTRAEVARLEAQPELTPSTWGDPVRILQPNISNIAGFDAAVVARNYRKVFELSRPLCQPGTLLIWPESAAWPFSYDRDPAFAAELQGLVRDGGCTILFNSTHEAAPYVYNSAYLLDGALADGAAPARYDKRHLVPFGEYVPFRGVFSFVDKLAREAGEFRPAEAARLLPWGRQELGLAICYEIVFPAEVAEMTRLGATMLVTITNDAWYGDTAAPWQHFRAARFRAAENRRPVLRAAITGISALIGVDGSVRREVGLFKEGVIRARVTGRQGLTPYARRPWLVPALSTLFAAFAMIAARRSRP